MFPIQSLQEMTSYSLALVVVRSPLSPNALTFPSHFALIQELLLFEFLIWNVFSVSFLLFSPCHLLSLNQFTFFNLNCLTNVTPVELAPIKSFRMHFKFKKRIVSCHVPQNDVSGNRVTSPFSLLIPPKNGSYPLRTNLRKRKGIPTNYVTQLRPPTTLEIPQPKGKPNTTRDPPPE